MDRIDTFLLCFSYVKRFRWFEILHKHTRFYKSHWDFRLNGKINFALVYFFLLLLLPFSFHRMNTKIKVWWQNFFLVCCILCAEYEWKKKHTIHKENVKHQTEDNARLSRATALHMMLDNIQMLYSFCSLFLPSLSRHNFVSYLKWLFVIGVQEYTNVLHKSDSCYFLHYFFLFLSHPNRIFFENEHSAWNVCESDWW